MLTSGTNLKIRAPIKDDHGVSMTKKIGMKVPLVELDGDEMARVMWAMVKEKLLLPHIELKTKYYDLCLKKRDETNDKITLNAAEAIRKYGVGVKCATITPNADRVKEFNLKQQWNSPNGTIRAVLDGTIFRTPITLSNIKPAVRSWKRPISIGRHAYGDVYGNVEHKVSGPGVAELVYTNASGEETRLTIQEFKGPGVIQGIHNLDSSIRSFARACFAYALVQKVDLWFATKDTISKTYDTCFREIFDEIYDEEYRDKFTRAGTEYFYTLIDDAVARAVKSEGGFVWACKNYDGDVMSDLVGAAYGSLAIMSSVLVSPEGYFEYEAAHGTVQRHYYRYLKGEKTSTNPMAIVFAWTGALRKRAESDKIPELIEFSHKLERATKETIENDGIMTDDLARISDPPAKKVASTQEFIDAIGERYSAFVHK